MMNTLKIETDEDSDQTVQLHSLIRVFLVCIGVKTFIVEQFR